MRIKTQIIATLLSAAALIGLVGGIAIISQMSLTRSAALAEATSVARQLAAAIAFKAADAPRSLFERSEALREFVTAQHSGSKRDLVVVDHNKTILADVPGEDRMLVRRLITIAATKSDGRSRTDAARLHRR